MPPSPLRALDRVQLGHLWLDVVSFSGALQRIEELVDEGAGGAVFTPNVDHVVTAEDDAAFRAAHGAARLVVADGQILVWAARLLRTPVPEKVSGSDLVWPLMERAGRRGWRVYLLGGAPGAAAAAGARFAKELGVQIVGIDDARIPEDAPPGAPDPVADRVRSAAPHLVLVALGAPKQEKWIHRNAARLGPAVALGIGASLDFLAGNARRAPRWMSRIGLEWLHRLAQDPRRMARRYLVKDPRFAGVLLRTLRTSRAERVRLGTPPAPSPEP